MAYLKHSKDGLRVYESYSVKDVLKSRNYTYDGRGFWYKLYRDIDDVIAEYRALDAEGVNLILGSLSLDEVSQFLAMSSKDIAALATKNPLEGMKVMKVWNDVKSWAKPKFTPPAKELIF